MKTDDDRREYIFFDIWKGNVQKKSFQFSFDFNLKSSKASWRIEKHKWWKFAYTTEDSDEVLFYYKCKQQNSLISSNKNFLEYIGR